MKREPPGRATWREVVAAVSARHAGLIVGTMFGMPCLKRPNGKVVAALWKDGGMSLRFSDQKARIEALSVTGARVASHAFDPSRLMREWVHVPPTNSGEWERLLELALRAH